MAGIRRLAIVGAGLAGLAAALAAAAAGLEVDVFDGADGLHASALHVDVVPNLLRDLASLGLGEACVRRGFPYAGVCFVDADGRQRFEVATPPLAGERLPAALGMTQRDLLGVVRDAAVQRGAAFHWGSPVRAIEVDHDRTRIVVADGPSSSVDLAVVAGATNVHGVTLPLHDSASRVPQRWHRAVLARPRGLDRSTWVMGRGLMKALLVPIGMRHAGLALLCGEHPSTPGAAPTALQLRSTLEAGGPALQSLAALLPDDALVFSQPVRSGLLAGPWDEGGVLRIGASAHVLPPHFGQSAAQCVEDAVVLGELLRQAHDRDELLAAFAARRVERVARIHALVTQAARWDLLPEPSTDWPALAQGLASLVERPA